MRLLRRCLSLIWVALVVLPVVTAGLWLGSGRENLTKSFRAVEIKLNDGLFGDTTDHTNFNRGPILGHFVGLDAVIASSAVSCVLLVFAAWRGRRRKRRGRRED